LTAKELIFQEAFNLPWSSLWMLLGVTSLASPTIHKIIEARATPRIMNIIIATNRSGASNY